MSNVSKKGQITDAIVEWFLTRKLELFRLDMRKRDEKNQVIPLKQRGKKPRFGGWRRSKSDPGKVRDWANQGLNLGWRIPKGTVVIDVDPRNGGSLKTVIGFLNVDSLQELASLHPVVKTGGGGYHIYARSRGLKLKSKDDENFPGIDFKQQGGYVVIPGSWHFENEKFYRFVEGDGMESKHFAFLNDTILGVLGKTTKPGNKSISDSSFTTPSPKLDSRELTELLNGINVMNYRKREEAWRELMMSSHHATAGQGLGAFIAWSTSDPAYSMEAENIEKRWNSLRVDGIDAITYRHILSTWHENNRKSDKTISAAIQSKCDRANFSGTFDAVLSDVEDMDEDDINKADVDDLHIEGLDDGDIEIEGLDNEPEDTEEFIERASASDDEEKAVKKLYATIARLKVHKMNDETFEAIYKMTLPFGTFVSTQLQESLRKKLGMTTTNFRSKASEVKIKSLNKEADKKLDRSFKALSELQDVTALIAKRVLNHFGNGRHIAYCREDLYIFNGMHWERQEETRIRAVATREISEVAKETKKVFHVSRDAIELVKQFAPVIDFDVPASKKADIFNFKNGEVWVGRKTGRTKTKKHNPKSKQLFVLDYNYDPDEECPVFDAALERMFDGKEDMYKIVDYVSELFGYTLSTNKNIAACIALIGSGSNGKSVLLNALKNITGAYAMNSPITALENSFTRAKLLGKLCLIDDDFAVDKKLPNEVIKKFSESKRVEVEEKFKRGFEIQSNVICWLSSNGWPYTGDASNAVFRRLHFVPFDNTFTAKDADNNINEKIRRETAGVFNFAIEGLQRLRRRGYFEKPDTVKKASESWNMSTNTVATFLDDFKTQGNTLRFTGVKSLYELYKEWCSETHQHTLSRLVFKRVLGELGLKESTKGIDLGVGYVDWSLLENLLDEKGGEISIREIEDACDEIGVDVYNHTLLKEYCKVKGYAVKVKGQKVIKIDATG